MEENEVLDTGLLIERKTGATTVFNIIEYPRGAAFATTVLFPNHKDYIDAIELMKKLVQAGTPVGAVDVLIATMCINRGMKLNTKDKDFKSIQATDSRLKVEVKQRPAGEGL